MMVDFDSARMVRILVSKWSLWEAAAGERWCKEIKVGRAENPPQASCNEF